MADYRHDARLAILPFRPMTTPLPFVSFSALLFVLLATGCPRTPVADSDGSAPPPPPEERIYVAQEVSADEPLIWTPPNLVIAEDDTAAALAQARQALDEGRLYEGEDAAIPLYLALRQFPSTRSAADTGVLRATRALLAQGEQAVAQAGDDAKALYQAQWIAAVLHALAAVLEDINQQAVLAQTATLLQEVERVSQVWALNDEGERALHAGQLGEDGYGALAHFRAAEALAPGQERALQGMVAVESALIERAERAALGDDFAAARTWLAHAAKVREDTTAVVAASQRVEHLRIVRIARLRAQAVAGLHHYGGTQKALGLLQHMQTMADPEDLVLADLRARIDIASHYGPFGPGQMFKEPLRDGGNGPAMVVVAYGAFQMGAVAGDLDAQHNEQPAHPVSFERGFAIALHEITVAEFGRFIRATGHQSRALRRGFSMAYDERSGNFVRRSGVDWQSDYAGNPAPADAPVLHVSAIDAAAYAAWLSAQTGAVYRLPSEAEFEYVLRAGDADIYPWAGDAPPAGAGNLTGSEDQSPSGRTWANAFDGYGDGYWGPAPVGQFAANAWGVHDLAGNVSEWVADCWHDSYRRAPADGSAWVNPGCRDQVIRGGAWASSPAQTRASWRAPASVDTTNARIGFRVVRVL